MMVRKPTILYYDNGQEEKKKSLEKLVSHMGISFIPITPAHFLQTIGYLAKIKGFPFKRVSPLTAPPEISTDVMVMCHFSEDKLDAFLTQLRSSKAPQIPLKAVLTAQNCFWTFSQLVQELQEHCEMYREEEE